MLAHLVDRFLPLLDVIDLAIDVAEQSLECIEPIFLMLDTPLRFRQLALLVVESVC